MSVEKITTNSANQTKKLGERLAQEVVKENHGNRAVVIGLEGNLGSGKTTFLQGFAKGLAVKEKILSPTFVIFKKFAIKRSAFKYFYHFDCYRIKLFKELLDLGIVKIASNPKNIIAVEWPKVIGKRIKMKTIKFKFISSKKRLISIYDR